MTSQNKMERPGNRFEIRIKEEPHDEVFDDSDLLSESDKDNLNYTDDEKRYGGRVKRERESDSDADDEANECDATDRSNGSCKSEREDEYGDYSDDDYSDDDYNDEDYNDEDYEDQKLPSDPTSITGSRRRIRQAPVNDPKAVPFPGFAVTDSSLSEAMSVSPPADLSMDIATRKSHDGPYTCHSDSDSVCDDDVGGSPSSVPDRRSTDPDSHQVKTECNDHSGTLQYQSDSEPFGLGTEDGTENDSEIENKTHEVYPSCCLSKLGRVHKLDDCPEKLQQCEECKKENSSNQYTDFELRMHTHQKHGLDKIDTVSSRWGFSEQYKLVLIKDTRVQVSRDDMPDQIPGRSYTACNNRYSSIGERGYLLFNIELKRSIGKDRLNDVYAGLLYCCYPVTEKIVKLFLKELKNNDYAWPSDVRKLINEDSCLTHTELVKLFIHLLRMVLESSAATTKANVTLGSLETLADTEAKKHRNDTSPASMNPIIALRTLFDIVDWETSCWASDSGFPRPIVAKIKGPD